MQENWAPLARIFARYAIGYFAGSEIGEQLALDDDLILVLSLALGAAVEGIYAYAKRHGGAL